MIKILTMINVRKKPIDWIKCRENQLIILNSVSDEVRKIP